MRLEIRDALTGFAHSGAQLVGRHAELVRPMLDVGRIGRIDSMVAFAFDFSQASCHAGAGSNRRADSMS